MHGSIERRGQLSVLSGDLGTDPVVCPSARDVEIAVAGVDGDDPAADADGENDDGAAADVELHPRNGIQSVLCIPATFLFCAQFLVGRSKSITGGIEKVSDGGGVVVARVGEGEGICCRDESWCGRGGMLVLGARTRKVKNGGIVGRTMVTFWKFLMASCALSSSLTRERLR